MNGTIIISGNIVKNNSVTPGTGTFLPQGGGGFYIDLCSPEMTNNIIIDNNAPKGGGVLVCGIDRGGLTGVVKPNLINNTISGNYASEFGGGIYSTYSISDTATIINTILWEDSAFSTGNEIYIADNPIDVAYSDIDPAEVFGNWNSINNINADPLFIAGDSLYHLTNSSPCVNTGADSIQIGGQWYYCPPYDYEGDERPYLGHQADMGADETQVPTVGIEPQPDAGLPQSYVLEKNYPNP
ncbi:MAG: hypothetical protein GWN00_00150, partial [Aliifodinibius sp.]|nr:hypothetical protein [Fodinibius sp.]NIY23278.1 hypothetical protein [Fodinibius sp.]